MTNFVGRGPAKNRGGEKKMLVEAGRFERNRQWFLSRGRKVIGRKGEKPVLPKKKI